MSFLESASDTFDNAYRATGNQQAIHMALLARALHLDLVNMESRIAMNTIKAVNDIEKMVKR